MEKEKFAGSLKFTPLIESLPEYGIEDVARKNKGKMQEIAKISRKSLMKG